jgi:hypothetical protein
MLAAIQATTALTKKRQVREKILKLHSNRSCCLNIDDGKQKHEDEPLQDSLLGSGNLDKTRVKLHRGLPPEADHSLLNKAFVSGSHTAWSSMKSTVYKLYKQKEAGRS